VAAQFTEYPPARRNPICRFRYFLPREFLPNRDQTMKRNLNLIRDLLLIIEGADGGAMSHSDHGLTPSDHCVQQHLRMLVEAGFVRGVGITGDGSICVRLTWDGHEFLELTRNEQLWARAKRYVHEKTGGMSVEALRAVLSAWSVMAVSESDKWRVKVRNGLHHSDHGNGNGKGVKLPPSRKPFVTSSRDATPVIPVADSEKDETFDDSHFQFNIWYGQEQDGLPIYLL
jgi:hypothetical protein